MRSSALSFAAIAVAVGLSLLIVHPAPSYDPLAWLLWGREVAGGALDTREGPAFKPLPVGVGAVLAPTGTAAPWLWIAVVRAAAVVSLWLAFRIARRLAGGSRVAGALAAVGVALCGGFLGTAAAGAETPLLLALALGGVEAWRRDRFGLVLACAIGCSLVRVEAVPFAALAGAVLWRRQPGLRPALVAAGVLVPAAWILPELVGSGDPLRSADRARVPNPGQPALADVPSLAAVEDAVRLPLWCLWIGLVPLVLRARGAFARAALAPAAVGLAWLLLVAVMAEVGFSGEARYSLPGAALVAISGAIGLAVGVRGRVMAAVAVALVAVAAVARLDTLSDVRERQAYQWTLAADLRDAIRTAGGRDAVLECGRPYVGPLRGPLLAYWLEVRKRDVEPDDPPRAPGVVFRSAIAAGEPADPPVPGGFARVSRSGTWETWRACAVRDP